MRGSACFKVLRRAFGAARERFGMRLCHFSVMGNHIHFLVEAEDKLCLAKAMQGLGVRVAKALNRVLHRRGRVLADRYHSRALATPSEVAAALHYVLRNAHRHGLLEYGIDYYASVIGAADITVRPRTWLLARGWRRARRAGDPFS